MMEQVKRERSHGKTYGMWLRVGLIAALLSPLTVGVGQVLPAYQGTQTTPTPQPGSSRPSLGNSPLGPPDPIAGPDPRKLEHMREDERHKRLQADIAKLVELTAELKVEVDKASKDELSVDVVRKAAEIEKLAHDVKERMKS